MKTILFGGSGLIGRTILEKNPDIISVGRTNPNTGNRHIFIPSMDNIFVLDGMDFTIKNVIFCIGNSNHHEINNSGMMGIEYNVIPLKKALHYFSNKKINKFVCLTTILLYGDENKYKPVDELQDTYGYQNEYIFSKYLAEELVTFYNHKVPIINIRISNIYGATELERPDLIPSLILDSITKNNISVWNDTPIRDFIFTEDAVDAIISLLNTDFKGIINVGTGESHSVREVCDIIEKCDIKFPNLLKSRTRFLDRLR